MMDRDFRYFYKAKGNEKRPDDGYDWGATLARMAGTAAEELEANAALESAALVVGQMATQAHALTATKLGKSAKDAGRRTIKDDFDRLVRFIQDEYGDSDLAALNGLETQMGEALRPSSTSPAASPAEHLSAPAAETVDRSASKAAPNLRGNQDAMRSTTPGVGGAGDNGDQIYSGEVNTSVGAPSSSATKSIISSAPAPVPVQGAVEVAVGLAAIKVAIAQYKAEFGTVTFHDKGEESYYYSKQKPSLSRGSVESVTSETYGVRLKVKHADISAHKSGWVWDAREPAENVGEKNPLVEMSKMIKDLNDRRATMSGAMSFQSNLPTKAEKAVQKQYEDAVALVQGQVKALNTLMLAPHVAIVADTIRNLEIELKKHKDKHVKIDANGSGAVEKSRYHVIEKAIKDLKEQKAVLENMQKCDTEYFTWDENGEICSAYVADGRPQDGHSPLPTQLDGARVKIEDLVNTANAGFTSTAGAQAKMVHEDIASASEDVKTRVLAIKEKYKREDIRGAGHAVDSKEAADLKRHAMLSSNSGHSLSRWELSAPAPKTLKDIVDALAGEARKDGPNRAVVDELLSDLDAVVQKNGGHHADPSLKKLAEKIQEYSRAMVYGTTEGDRNAAKQQLLAYSDVLKPRTPRFDKNEHGMRVFANFVMEMLSNLQDNPQFKHFAQLEAGFSKHPLERLNPMHENFSLEHVYKMMRLHQGAGENGNNLKDAFERAVVDAILQDLALNPESDFAQSLREGYHTKGLSARGKERTTVSAAIDEDHFSSASSVDGDELARPASSTRLHSRSGDSVHLAVPDNYGAMPSDEEMVRELVRGMFAKMEDPDPRDESLIEAFEGQMKAARAEQVERFETKLMGTRNSRDDNHKFEYKKGQKEKRHSSSIIAHMDAEINDILEDQEDLSWKLKGVSFEGVSFEGVLQDETHDRSVTHDLQAALEHRYEVLVFLGVEDGDMPAFKCTAGKLATLNLQGEEIRVTKGENGSFEFKRPAAAKKDAVSQEGRSDSLYNVGCSKAPEQRKRYWGQVFSDMYRSLRLLCLRFCDIAISREDQKYLNYLALRNQQELTLTSEAHKTVVFSDRVKTDRAVGAGLPLMSPSMMSHTGQDFESRNASNTGKSRKLFSDIDEDDDEEVVLFNSGSTSATGLGGERPGTPRPGGRHRGFS